MKRLALVVMFFFLSATTAFSEGFTLTSPDVSGQLSKAQVYSGFGCTGKNISPALSWKNAPEGTRSFAVTAYDPDAPTGSGWWHWIIFNIPASVHELKAGVGNPDKNLAPEGAVQSINSYGKQGYGGACPPEGAPAHRYIFTVYALKTDKLDMGPSTQAPQVGFALHQNALAKASVIGYYGR